MSTGFDRRVQRLREHVLNNQKEAEKAKEPTVAELKAMLDEKGIEYNPKAKKTELLELLENANKREDKDEDEGAE